MRLIQVGVGSWGMDWSRRIIPQVDEVDVQAYVSRTAQRRDIAQQELAIPSDKLFSSLDRALNATDADAVLIVTPTNTHATLIEEALNADKHVLVEKPMVTQIDAALPLIKLAERRNRVFMVNQNFRYFPAVQHAASLLRSGEFGELSSIHIDFQRAMHDMSDNRAKWLHSIRDPLLADLGIHHFDLMRLMVGSEPVAANCVAWRPAWSRFNDCYTAEVVVQFPGSIAVTWTGNCESRAQETTWTGTWRMVCESADIVWSARGDRDISLDGDEVHIQTASNQSDEREIDRPARFSRAAVLEEFVSAVQGNRLTSWFPSASDNVKSLALLDAILKSKERGCSIDVDNVDCNGQSHEPAPS